MAQKAQTGSLEVAAIGSRLRELRKETELEQQPLSRQDMKILHLLRELSPEGRAEVQEFLEFKLRKERQGRRSIVARRSGENGS